MQVSFNRVAPIYDLLSSIVYGKQLRNAQIHFLAKIKPKAKVLVLGGGTGWLLEELANENLEISIDYVEASEKMLEKSKSYAELPFVTLNFILGTEQSVADKKYDFIITPFVLDVFPKGEMKEMVERVSALLNSGASWLCVDFNCFDTSFKAKVLSFTMVHFFRLVSGLKVKKVLDYFGEIEKVGLQETNTAYYYGKFIRASLYK